MDRNFYTKSISSVSVACPTRVATVKPEVSNYDYVLVNKQFRGKAIIELLTIIGLFSTAIFLPIVAGMVSDLAFITSLYPAFMLAKIGWLLVGGLTFWKKEFEIVETKQ